MGAGRRRRTSSILRSNRDFRSERARTSQSAPEAGCSPGATAAESADRHEHHTRYRPARACAQPGDVIVVDARGDIASGVFGEMMLTYFKGRGGIGAVIDGCVRDWPHIEPLDLGLWMRGVTPNHGWQNTIMPFAVNVPIACAGVL